MKSIGVNFSTGPVNISLEVQAAIAAAPISHRSKEFQHLYFDTKNFLCEQFNVQDVFLMTGSGTLANEAMIWQIKIHGGKGLILSSGEFGSRLTEQAKRASLDFIEDHLNWGGIFDLVSIENKIQQNKITWVLFCHCETSTGVVNDLNKIAAICSRQGSLCFVDCMSTVGTHNLDLSKVSMATASSGKGFASVPGLSIIFSNIQTLTSDHLPLYLDLFNYTKNGGVPFTISSNLIYALHTSLKQKLRKGQFEMVNYYVKSCFNILTDKGMLPFCNEHSNVFTLASGKSNNIIENFRRHDILLSFESSYLIKRDLCQIAFFGYHQQTDLQKLFKAIHAVKVVYKTSKYE